MNDILKERLLRKLEALPEEKAYQVLDYIEFLESKYAERPGGGPAFPKVAENLADTMHTGPVPITATRFPAKVTGSCGHRAVWKASPLNVPTPSTRGIVGAESGPIAVIRKRALCRLRAGRSGEPGRT